ncbi:hypothetical protein M426DRAFT_23022 [Hypoxylon sp. CI-4A]|nr:hypothetical protein M426DRAFT_23022 [Hypoxylon sp. CI-4A]
MTRSSLNMYCCALDQNVWLISDQDTVPSTQTPRKRLRRGSFQWTHGYAEHKTCCTCLFCFNIDSYDGLIDLFHGFESQFVTPFFKVDEISCCKASVFVHMCIVSDQYPFRTALTANGIVSTTKRRGTHIGRKRPVHPKPFRVKSVAREPDRGLKEARIEVAGLGWLESADEKP